MELLSPNSLFMMERSMDFLWKRQATILENIAHVETPGYKAKYVTFEETMRSRIISASGGTSSQMRQAVAQAPAAVRETTDQSTRMDGNSVNATQQGVEMARTALQLQYTMGAISSDLSLLRTAIRGQ